MAYNREAYLLNREVIIERQKQWNKENEKVVRAYLEYWQAKNPDKVAVYAENRKSGKALLTKMAKEERIAKETEELVLKKHEEKIERELQKERTKAERREERLKRRREAERTRRQQKKDGRS